MSKSFEVKCHINDSLIPPQTLDVIKIYGGSFEILEVEDGRSLRIACSAKFLTLKLK